MIERSAFGSVLAVCTFCEHDEATIRFAADVALHHRSKLSVLGVQDTTAELVQIARHANVPQHAVSDWLRETLLADAREATQRAGPPDAAVSVRIGKTFLETIRAVQEGQHDLVIKTAERVEGVGGYLFASTDQHLIRKCPSPVWLKVPGQRPTDAPVLAAIDADEAMASEPKAQAELNDRILKLAQDVAAFAGASLYVVTAWDAPGETLARRWFNDEDSVDEYMRDVERDRHATLDAVIRRTSPSATGGDAALTITPILRRGTARAVIADFVRVTNAGHLVMGTIARTGLTGFLIGNTAEDVINSVTCSVLTVKPHGFVSPVR